MGTCQSRARTHDEGVPLTSAVVPETIKSPEAVYATRERVPRTSRSSEDGATSDAGAPSKGPRDGGGELPLGVLVKIFTVEATINYALPWQVEEQLEFTGSGFTIESQQIVTNAHVIAQAVSVRVRREGYAEKFEARVFAVCPEMDLAVLTVSCFGVVLFRGPKDRPTEARASTHSAPYPRRSKTRPSGTRRPRTAKSRRRSASRA